MELKERPVALPVDKLGTTYGPTTSVIDPARARAYAAATNDTNPAYESGKFAPPVFGVVPVWDLLGGVTLDIVPAESLLFIVHGEQDMHFHQPLVPGVELTTTGSPESIRVGGSGTRLVARFDSVDGDGRPVLTQYVTTFIRGMTDGSSAGPDAPGHDFPAAAREHQRATVTFPVDPDQTFRYAEASGDQMPIHLDDDVAQSVGLPGIIVHGLCTMAFCGRAVVDEVAGGDPSRLRRLAVRFAANLFPGEDLTVSLFDAGTAVAFEASAGDRTVIKNGWAEVEA
jgi:acyl dehydratase